MSKLKDLVSGSLLDVNLLDVKGLGSKILNTLIQAVGGKESDSTDMSGCGQGRSGKGKGATGAGRRTGKMGGGKGGSG